VIVDQAKPVLARVYQNVGTNFINDARDTRTVIIDLCDRTLGKDLTLCSGIRQLMADIFPCLGSVIMVKNALDVDSLTDRCTFL